MLRVWILNHLIDTQLQAKYRALLSDEEVVDLPLGEFQNIPFNPASIAWKQEKDRQKAYVKAGLTHYASMSDEEMWLRYEHVQWTTNINTARNHAINHAKQRGFSWCIPLDMFCSFTKSSIKQLMEELGNHGDKLMFRVPYVRVARSEWLNESIPLSKFHERKFGEPQVCVHNIHMVLVPC